MKYKVGDWVHIRQWDDMKDEYGLDDYGRILVPKRFVSGMRRFCGHWGKITSVHTGYYKMNFRFDDNECVWSDEMLEPEPVYKPGDTILLRPWTDMQADFNMNGIGSEDGNPSGLVGDFSKFFVDVPLTIKEIKTYKHADEGILVEDIPESEFSLKFFEFTKYCINHVVSVPLTAPTLSFADLFEV